MSLKQKVMDLAQQEGASLVGFSIPERFSGAPRGHAPDQLLKGARSVVTFGVAIPKMVSYWDELLTESEMIPEEARLEVLQGYYYKGSGYNIINDRLDQIALRLTRFLEDEGYLSIYFPATYGSGFAHIMDLVPNGVGLFSQRHAAVRAGLGEFGFHNVVITEEYGSKIRFNSVITMADLEPTDLVAEKICLGGECNLCVEACAGGAITVSSGVDGNGRVAMDPVSRTNIPLCRKCIKEIKCQGKCIRVCPVGVS